MATTPHTHANAHTIAKRCSLWHPHTWRHLSHANANTNVPCNANATPPVHRPQRPPRGLVSMAHDNAISDTNLDSTHSITRGITRDVTRDVTRGITRGVTCGIACGIACGVANRLAGTLTMGSIAPNISEWTMKRASRRMIKALVAISAIYMAISLVIVFSQAAPDWVVSVLAVLCATGILCLAIYGVIDD